MKNKRKRPKHTENGPTQCGDGVCGARPPRRIERRKGFPDYIGTSTTPRTPVSGVGRPNRADLVGSIFFVFFLCFLFSFSVQFLFFFYNIF
jgi:hypothetical protein